MFDYKLEDGRIIRINEQTIQNLMDNLKIDREDAIQVYLEDEGYEINEEQEALTKKAKDNRITATIHKAEGKPREKKKVERKPNPDKEFLIKSLYAAIENVEGSSNAVIENIGKLITFEYNGKKFKLDLVETRSPKK